MLRKNLPSSGLARVGVLGLLAITTAVIFTTDAAEARRYRYRHHAYHRVHRETAESYSPLFSSIIVDANSGATLQATNPDAPRHPASLTKIMTLYLLFERLEAGKIRLDTEMPVSEHASEQAPTKLGLHPGQSIRVEDAIEGLVTRSANDAAVVIAEALGGDEDDFAQMMTRKARALGMSKTLYRNASGLPNDEQLTTARDQATLGRAIQDRFPRYYRYFSTASFYFRGQSIRNHNHLLGSLEGVDGIKTGYTRASGFNLVTSMRRGNRHLVGVVLGGRSGGSRDAIMRNLLAENLAKAATARSVAAITERNSSNMSIDVADASGTPARMSAPAAATGSVHKAEAKVEPAPPTNSGIVSQPLSIVPGSAEPIKPVKVRTVQVKWGATKVASNTAAQPVEVTETSDVTVPKADVARADLAKAGISKLAAAMAQAAHPDIPHSGVARTDLPPQPPGHGTGNGILGVLPASSLTTPGTRIASTEPAPQPAQMSSTTANTATVDTPTKSIATHTGWIVQVGALDTENEAQQRIEDARSSARGLLTKANSFTEAAVAKDNHKVFRARFAGLERNQAEAVCRTLKRAKISCIAIRN